MPANTQTVREVFLPWKEYDKWGKVRRAYGRQTVVTRACLSMHGVRTADIREFIRIGLLKLEGEEVRRAWGIKVSEKRCFNVHLDEEINKDLETPSEVEKVWTVIHAFTPGELKLFRTILDNADWSATNKQALVRLNPVKEAGFTKPEVIELLNRFGYQHHDASSGMPLPTWWKDEILPEIQR